MTVERVVDDLSPWAERVLLPAHRVLAIVEAPFGAHPGGVFARGLPADGYGEDVDFWVGRARRRSWRLRRVGEDVVPRAEHPRRLPRAASARDRLDWLRARTDPSSWQADAAAWPVDEDVARDRRGRRRRPGAHAELVDRIEATGAHAVLAGAGVANLAAWVGVETARARGHAIELTAELGLWGYHPTPADPYIFNQRSFPGASRLTDASHVLGQVIGGQGNIVIGCLGAAQVDRHGNINSTLDSRRPLPGGLGRRQRRRLARQRVRRHHAGAPRPSARAGRLRHQPRRPGAGGRHRSSASCAGATAISRLAAVGAGTEPLGRSGAARRRPAAAGTSRSSARSSSSIRRRAAEVTRFASLDPRGLFLGR